MYLFDFLDPVTKEWLQKHRNNIFGFPTLVRFSWETCKSIIAKDGIDVHWLEVRLE